MPEATLIEKVQKLLALAESSNEHEATLAAEKAQELMLRYGIELAHIAALADKEVGIGSNRIGCRIDPWRRALARAVAVANGCDMVYTGLPRKWTGDFTFWGPRDTLPGVVTLYQYLEAQLVVISRLEAVKVSHASAARSMQWRRSFLVGAVSRISARLESRARKVEQESAVNSQALVVIRDSVESAMRADARARGMVLTSKRTKSHVHPGAYAAGQEAGDGVDLRDPKLTGGRSQLATP